MESQRKLDIGVKERIDYYVIEHGAQTPLVTRFDSREEADQYIETLSKSEPVFLIAGELLHEN